MNSNRIIRLAYFLVFSQAIVMWQPAYGNPPGGVSMLSFILTLPSVMFCSALAGQKNYGTSFAARIMIISGLAVLFFLAATPSFSFWVFGLFAAYAFWRGFDMLHSGLAKKQQGAKRLVIAGTSLLLITTMLLGAEVAFFVPVQDLSGDVPLVRFVQYELSYAKSNANSTGHRRFKRLSDKDKLWEFLAFSGRKPDRMHISYSKDDSEFTVTSWCPVPMFPFNFLVGRPCFRADGTGVIRMSLAHQPGQECHPDAPIIFQVTDEQIQKVMPLWGWLSERYDALKWAAPYCPKSAPSTDELLHSPNSTECLFRKSWMKTSRI